VWASEAERKRAYRERLAADRAEPERLRRELRAERKRVADQDRQLSRFVQDLTRAKGLRADFAAREAELKSAIEHLEAKVEFWRAQARAIEKRLDEERDRAREQEPKRRVSRSTDVQGLPDLRLQQGQNPPLSRSRSKRD
jgi:chromosome segregation ATPase